MLGQVNLFSDLSPEVRETILRIFAVIAALVLIFLTRRLLTLLALMPIRRLIGASASSERLLELVIGPVRLVLIAGALLVSARLLAPYDLFFQSFVGVIVRMLLILATLVLIYRVIDLLLPSGARLAALTGFYIEERLIPFLRVGIKLFVFAVGVVIIVQELGYDVSGLIAGIGIGGLAISLAAQDTIANLFGFASIVGDRPFAVGDFIRTPDAEGSVEHVGMRSTRIRKHDQTLITLPNNKLANSPISNLSRMVKRWIDMTLNLSHVTTSAQIRDLVTQVREMLKEWPNVDPNSVQVFFSKFSPTSLDMIVRCYIQKQAWVDAMFEQEAMQLRIMEMMEELGIRLAAPPQTVIVQGPSPASKEKDWPTHLTP